MGPRSASKIGPPERKFSRVLQTDIPSYTLDKALTVPQMLADQFARKPVSPLKLAAAMKVRPTSPSFRMLTGAAIAYGLTKGGWNAAQIELTPLGTRIVHVTNEGDDVLARREALLKPRVFGTLLTRYDGHPIPRKDIAVNILKDLGVPEDRAEGAMDMMLDGARAVGFITTLNGKDYVSLEGTSIPQPEDTSGEVSAEEMEETVSIPTQPQDHPKEHKLEIAKPMVGEPRSATNGWAQIPYLLRTARTPSLWTRSKSSSHSVNSSRSLQLRTNLSLNQFPDKVMDEMRSCSAAIIHVDAERAIVDKDGKEHVLVNSNVLIEIGAAFSLYGRRFILLVREGVQLPSNLQGLYEVRYSGETLDANTTIKLLEAITDIQNNALPNRYGDR